MKIDLDQIPTNAKGEPYTVTVFDGQAIYRMLVSRRDSGATLAEVVKEAEEMAGGKDFLRPMDLGDLFYRANEQSPKMSGGTKSEKRMRGELEEKLVKRGVVEFTHAEIEAIKEDCELRYTGAVLVRLDRIFARATLAVADDVAAPGGAA